MAIANDDRSYMELDPPEGFQALQDKFSFNRRARPPPMDISQANFGDSRVPLKEHKVQRRESKGGLRGMFTRNKTDKVAVTSVLEEDMPTSAISERTMTAVADEASIPRSMDLPRVASIPIIPAAPARPTTMGSRMNLRAKSQISVKTARSSPKSPKSSTKSSPRRPTRSSAAWDPPPLFQAYPQAIKHATLSASTLSADAILRMSNHKRTNSLRDEIAQTGSDGLDQDGTARKSEKAKSKHRRQISGSISKADWTQKIFVLVTSGYLLQYSGDGSFDRLPEKMLQLGRDSVAFASDVIPGKHWVLQISQALDEKGTPAADSRSLLSRLAFRGADYRRTATSLLLVLNSAEDMDSWIAIVRREIEALGGKKAVSETGKPKPDDKIMQLRAQPSHRYIVTRDPDQFSNPASPQLPSFGPPPWVKEKDDELQQKLNEVVSALQPPAVRPSTGQQSITNSIASNDGRQLDNLRDSTRFSYMSSGQRTLITSQGSSPATSPTRNSGPSFDDAPKISTEDIRLRPNASAINERRRSMQTMHIPILEAPPNPKNYRHSTYGGPARAASVLSPGTSLTPNFSVPNSSSKRYPTAKSLTADHPPLPASNIFSTRPRDSTLKGTRKSPPTALNVTRPLSPVKDSISPKQAPKQKPVIVRHRNSTFEMLQVRPALIDVPPRSPGSRTPSPTKENAPSRSDRLSSLIRSHSQVQTRTVPIISSRPILPAEQISSDSSSTITITNHRESETRGEKELPQLPTLANTKTKVRRPISMQTPPPSTPPITTNNRAASLETHTKPSPVSSLVWSSPASSINQPPNSGRPFSITSTASSGTLNRGALSPVGHGPVPVSMVLMSPSLQRVKDQGKMLGNRRSMPLLNGPPPAPPPDCALPPLPAPGGSREGSMKSPVSVRGGGMRVV